MKRRVNEIELIAGEKRQMFEINHAERILRMQNNGGWKIPEDSEFELNKNNGIINAKRIKRTNTESEKG